MALDGHTFSSSCLSSLSRSTCGRSVPAARPPAPDAPWLVAQDRLSGLLTALRGALGRMELDRRQILLGCPDSASLSERLRNLSAYLEPAECAALRAFEADDLSGRLLHGAECPPALKAALRRLEARVRATLEDANLLQEDVGYLLMTAEEDDGQEAAGERTEERCVSRAFLSELVSRAHLAERENRSLRASQAKLKRVLREAKEQRRQLKDLARRLKQEREQAVLEVCRLSDRLRGLDAVQDDVGDSGDVLSAAAAAAEAADEASLESVAAPDTDDEESRTAPSLPMALSGRRAKLLPRALEDRRGKLCIFVRIRPDESGFLEVASKCKIVLRTRGLPGASGSLCAFNCRAFYYDRVFGAESSSGCVFGAMSELINSCCYGVNVCIMAYGQTGSGKTYTMVGDQLNPGVNRLSIASILRFCRCRVGWQYSFAMSAVEIYKEEIRDLLRNRGCRPRPGSPRTAAAHHQQPSVLKLVTDFNGDAVMQGLTELPVTTEADIDTCIAQCESTRIYSATNLNEVSSRSHVIVMLRINGKNLTSEHLSVKSTLTLCDLAGSESVVKSGVRGAGLREASAINRSLLSLGKVFEDLRKRQRPCFRESKLTRLLQPHLTGNSKCLVIVTVRQSVNFLDETVRSLMFGQSAMQTEPRDCTARDSATASEAARIGGLGK